MTATASGGQIVVVKLGGAALNEDVSSFAGDVVALRDRGIPVVVVHGGGPQIGAAMARWGKEAAFVDGHRVTDAETLDIVRMVLVGKINRDLVGAINAAGARAVGLTGEDAGLLVVVPRAPELGLVGDVKEVTPDIVIDLLAGSYVPVMATIGTDGLGQAYNVNADVAAAALAAVVGAGELVYLSDVDGVRADPGDPATVIDELSGAQIEEMISTGVIAGGMIPKARSAAVAVAGGVGRVRIIDGRVDHALLSVVNGPVPGTVVAP